MSRPAPAGKSDYKRHVPVQMRWADTDIYGHMNNAVHYTLFDTAVQIFLTQERLLDLGRSATIFLVVSSGCDYFDQISFGDSLTAGLKITRLGASSIRYDIALFRNDSEISAAAGHFTHVNVVRDTRKPALISDAARAIFSQLS